MTSGHKLWVVTTLTLLRVPLVLLFFVGAIFFSESRTNWIFIAAFTSLIASAVTDFFDGLLARYFKVETPFGAHVDPLMDKFFYLATFPLLIFICTKNALGPAPRDNALTHAIVVLVLTLLFLSRDQWVTFLRSIGSIYNISGRAHWSGKVRTAITFPLLCVIYHVEEAPRQYQFIAPWFMYGFEAVALTINTISLYTYTRFYWPYLRKSATPALVDQPASTPRPPLPPLQEHIEIPKSLPFKVGVALIVASIPLGWIGIAIGGAMAAAGLPRSGLIVGTGIYIISWAAFGIGLVMAGREGLQYVKGLRGRWLRRESKPLTPTPPPKS